jgi:RNA polymerase sigma-70 factor (ECF subfamily)
VRNSHRPFFSVTLGQLATIPDGKSKFTRVSPNQNSANGAFTELVLEHQAGLRAFIRMLGVDPAWVDDLAQECFLTAFQAFERFEQDKDFGKWLRGIARKLVINERRKQGRRARLLSGSFVELMFEASGPEGVSVPDDTPLLVNVMIDCIQQLPARSQELLRKRYQADHNASTLAAVFQMSPEAVRQSLSRIRAAVKHCIESKVSLT